MLIIPLCFFVCKTDLFSFQNNPKDLDLSFKTDLDQWDYFRRVKFILLQNVIGLVCSHSREGKKPSYSLVNTVIHC